MPCIAAQTNHVRLCKRGLWNLKHDRFTLRAISGQRILRTSLCILFLFIALAEAAPTTPEALENHDSPSSLKSHADRKVCFSGPFQRSAELPEIRCYGLFTLTPRIRSQLGAPVEAAVFPDLDSLADEDALLLARVPGTVRVKVSTELSVKAAEYFSCHRGYLSLESLRVLSDDAARALGQHRGDLSLLSLVRLSNDAMDELAHCAGKLSLGLENITAEQARILCQHHGGLCLHKVRAIDEAAAEVLARYPGTLEIGLAELSPGVARHLAKRTGSLAFNTLRQQLRLRMTPAAAGELARYRGELVLRLDCDGPPDNVVAALATHRGKLVLVLDQPLSVNMAKALSNHDGPLAVSAPLALSLDAAHCLAHHRSALDVATWPIPSAEVIQALSAHKGGDLELLLEGHLDEATARSLGTYRGRLTIHEVPWNPIQVTARVASALASHHGPLCLPSSLVREDTAENFSAHAGGLHVRYTGEEAPSIEIARKLAATKGWLRIDAAMPAETLRTIASHKGDLALGYLPSAREEVETLLRRNEGNLYFLGRTNVQSVAAARLLACATVGSGVNGTRCLLGHDAVEIASALAQRKGTLSMPQLEYVTVEALHALIQKPDVELRPLGDLYVFDAEGCIVPASDVVPVSFQEFNRTHQPPRHLDSQTSESD